MKKLWSRSWVRSKQPRKQRKYRVNAPLNIARKFMSVMLSKDLRKKHNKRNIPIRKGDTVKIMVGKYKTKIGKVEIVDLIQRKVYVEGIFLEKRDGNKKQVGLEPSNLMAMELDLGDKLRRKVLEKK